MSHLKSKPAWLIGQAVRAAGRLFILTRGTVDLRAHHCRHLMARKMAGSPDVAAHERANHSAYSDYDRVPGRLARGGRDDLRGGAEQGAAKVACMLSQVLGRARSPWCPVILGALLIFADAFCLKDAIIGSLILIRQGVIAGFVGAGLLLIGVPRALMGKSHEVRRQRLRNLAIYFIAVGLVFALNGANSHIARTRAERLVVAVKAYEARHHRYPQSLSELVPEFVDHVPLANYTLLPVFNQFHYFTSERGPHLLYFDMPPGHPVYSFIRDQWIYLD